MKTTAKVLLALLGGILFPIAIWVALGMAIQKMIEKKEGYVIVKLADVLKAADLALVKEE